MGVFMSMRDLQKQAKEIETTMPSAGDQAAVDRSNSLSIGLDLTSIG
jgi:hypothetical protein